MTRSLAWCSQVAQLIPRRCRQLATNTHTTKNTRPGVRYAASWFSCWWQSGVQWRKRGPSRWTTKIGSYLPPLWVLERHYAPWWLHGWHASIRGQRGSRWPKPMALFTWRTIRYSVDRAVRDWRRFLLFRRLRFCPCGTSKESSTDILQRSNSTTARMIFNSSRIEAIM